MTPTSPEARDLRILVAEPSRTLSALIRAALADLGAEIELAADGANALASARARLPDLVVCDQGLPGLDGYALAHAIKQLPGGKKVATLLLVPDHVSPDPERLAYVGIQDVLAKPFERAVLLERVRAMLALPSRSSVPRRPEPRVEAPRVEPRPPERAYEPRAPTFAPPAEPRREVRGEEVEAQLTAIVETRLSAIIDARLSTLVTQRLPSLLDGALTRLLPQAVLEATQRAVAERVPQAVEGAARVALAEVATPTRIDRIVGDIARQVVEHTIAEALAPLVAGSVESVKARVEGELLGRLDTFARTELPARLTAHAEQIVWKVVPTIAEDLVKEEIKRLTQE